MFPLPDSYFKTYSETDSKCRKATLGPILMQSYYENYFKNYLIGTDIGVKLGTVPTCIRIGIGIGIRIGSVETVLHIIILAI